MGGWRRRGREEENGEAAVQPGWHGGRTCSNHLDIAGPVAPRSVGFQFKNARPGRVSLVMPS